MQSSQIARDLKRFQKVEKKVNKTSSVTLSYDGTLQSTDFAATSLFSLQTSTVWVIHQSFNPFELHLYHLENDDHILPRPETA